jgi:hypothetical protein
MRQTDRQTDRPSSCIRRCLAYEAQDLPILGPTRKAELPVRPAAAPSSDRQTDNEADRQTDRQTDRMDGSKTDGPVAVRPAAAPSSDRHTDNEAGRQTGWTDPRRMDPSRGPSRSRTGIRKADGQ